MTQKLFLPDSPFSTNYNFNIQHWIGLGKKLSFVLSSSNPLF